MVSIPHCLHLPFDTSLSGWQNWNVGADTECIMNGRNGENLIFWGSSRTCCNATHLNTNNQIEICIDCKFSASSQISFVKCVLRTRRAKHVYYIKWCLLSIWWWGLSSPSLNHWNYPLDWVGWLEKGVADGWWCGLWTPSQVSGSLGLNTQNSRTAQTELSRDQREEGAVSSTNHPGQSIDSWL